MKTYKVYSKIVEKGKVTGRKYLSGVYDAKNKQEATNKAKRENNAWSRRTGYETPKVVEVKEEGVKKTRMKKQPNHVRSFLGF